MPEGDVQAKKKAMAHMLGGIVGQELTLDEQKILELYFVQEVPIPIVAGQIGQEISYVEAAVKTLIQKFQRG